MIKSERLNKEKRKMLHAYLGVEETLSAILFLEL